MEEAGPRKSRQDVWDRFRGCEKPSLAGEKEPGEARTEQRQEKGLHPSCQGPLSEEQQRAANDG